MSLGLSVLAIMVWKGKNKIESVAVHEIKTVPIISYRILVAPYTDSGPTKKVKTLNNSLSKQTTSASRVGVNVIKG